MIGLLAVGLSALVGIWAIDRGGPSGTRRSAKLCTLGLCATAMVLIHLIAWLFAGATR